MTRGTFESQPAKVITVRNKVYHHTNTGQLNRVREIMEDMLDRLDIHLETALAEIHRHRMPEPPAAFRFDANRHIRYRAIR